MSGAVAAASPTPTLRPTANDKQYAEFVFAVTDKSKRNRALLLAYAYSPFGEADIAYEAGMKAEGVIVSAQAIKQCIREMLVRH